MASARTVPRAEWRPYFDLLSKILTASRTQVESASLELGDQIVAEWLPLVGITYDSHNDLFDVALEGREHFNHLIRRPQQVVVQHEGGVVESIVIKTEDGTEEIVKFKEALLLPEASAGA